MIIKIEFLFKNNIRQFLTDRILFFNNFKLKYYEFWGKNGWINNFWLNNFRVKTLVNRK